AARPFPRRSANPAAKTAKTARTASAATSNRTARIRRAIPSDVDAIAQFGLAEIRYDAHFGGVIDRPWAGPAMRQYLAGLLTQTEPEPGVGVAEAKADEENNDENGAVLLGLLAAEPPQAAEWISPLTALSPVAYLMTAFVAPSARGTGIGGDLTDEFHA